jgi:hypothetical protein
VELKNHIKINNKLAKETTKDFYHENNNSDDLINKKSNIL